MADMFVFTFLCSFEQFAKNKFVDGKRGKNRNTLLEHARPHGRHWLRTPDTPTWTLLFTDTIGLACTTNISAAMLTSSH